MMGGPGHDAKASCGTRNAGKQAVSRRFASFNHNRYEGFLTYTPNLTLGNYLTKTHDHPYQNPM